MTAGFNHFLGLNADQWEESRRESALPFSPAVPSGRRLTIDDMKAGAVAMLRLLDEMAVAESKDVIVYRDDLRDRADRAIEQADEFIERKRLTIENDPPIPPGATASDILRGYTPRPDVSKVRAIPEPSRDEALAVDFPTVVAQAHQMLDPKTSCHEHRCPLAECFSLHYPSASRETP